MMVVQGARSLAFVNVRGPRTVRGLVRTVGFSVAALGMLSVLAQRVHADTQAATFDSASEMPSGDGSGVGPWLRAKGVDLSAVLVGEAAGNVDRSEARTARYAQEIDLGAVFNLAKTFPLATGELHVLLLSREGRSLSEDHIHNLFPVQEDFGGERRVRLMSLYYSATDPAGHWDWAVGRLVETADFGHSELYCQFQSLTVCAVPHALVANGGFSVWPFSTWGIRAKGQIGGGVYVQVGAYEAKPENLNHDGFDLRTNGDTGVSVPLEIGLVTRSTERLGAGTFKLGAVYDSSRTPDRYRDAVGMPFAISGQPAAIHDGHDDLYVTLEQVLTGDADAGRPQWSLFGGVVLADRDRSFFHDFTFAGLRVTGLVRSRPADSAGIVASSGHVSPDLSHTQQLEQALGLPATVQSRETLVEVNYGLRLTQWLALTPNLQAIVAPGADRNRPTIWIVGAKFIVDL